MVEEINKENRNIRFIKTEPRYITPESYMNIDYVPNGNTVDVIALSTSLQKDAEKRLESVGKKPEGKLLESVNIAKDFVKEVYQRTIPESSNQINLPEVVVLPPNDADQVAQEYPLGITSKDTGAFIIPGVDKVYIIENPELPDYIAAGAIAHEYIHLTFDSLVGVFSSKSAEDFTSFTSEQGFRRKGLVVDKVVISDGRISETTYTGELLNELANFAYEAEMQQRIIRGEKGGGQFDEELKTRKELLKRNNIEENGNMGWKLSDETNIWLSEWNTHYKKDGKMLLNQGVLMYELIDGLDTVFGEMDGKLLSQKLLEAKTNPAVQPEIQKRFDEVMGKGYYYKIKNTAYTQENILSLLVEVQNKLVELSSAK